MSAKSSRKKRTGPRRWQPIDMGGGVFIPSGPPMIATKKGLRPLSALEAARRFPGVDFGFPLVPLTRKRTRKRRT